MPPPQFVILVILGALVLSVLIAEPGTPIDVGQF